MENWAYIVGIVMGCLTLLSVLYVWVSKQQFGWGGASLSVFGIILIGLSLWQTIEISITKEGLTTRLDKLEGDIQTLATTNSQLSEELTKMVTQVETSNEQYLKLTNTLRTRGYISTQQYNELKAPLQNLEPVDKNVLDDAKSSYFRIMKPAPDE